MSLNLPLREFYMLRHGESVENERGVTQGSSLIHGEKCGGNAPLTPKGYQQADVVIPIINMLNPKPIIIADPGPVMVRTRQTTQRINAGISPPLNIIAIPDLRERNWGDWTGILKDEPKRLVKLGQVPPNGESEAEINQRVLGAMTEALNYEEPGPVLIIAHRASFERFAALFGKKLEPGNCEVHHFIPYPHDPNFPWNVMRVGLHNGQIFEENVFKDEPSVQPHMGF